MINVKYRNGYPTKISLQQTIDTFFNDTFNKPHIGHSQGVLIWQRKGINERIEDFRAYLESLGVQVERCNLYESPRIGSIMLKKKV
mgnify:CR=1 FL=1